MKHLSTFIHSLDLVRARPLPGRLLEQPAHTLDVVFGVDGEDLCIYLADERERPTARDLPDGQTGDPRAGEPISGRLTLALPAGTYDAMLFDPKIGLYSPAITLPSDGLPLRIALPAFVHDLVIRIRRASA